MRYTDNDGMPVTIYEPNETQGGFIRGLQRAGGDIAASKHVIMRLFWRDFIAQFRQKLLGYFWALLSPLLGIASFLFLFFVGVLRPGEGEIPYPVYVMVGSAIWGCLPGAMGAVSGGLQAQADLIMRTRIPKVALALSSLAGLSYGILISMATMTIIFILTGAKPTWWLLAYPLLALPMVLLGTSIGLVLSVLGSIARDLTPMVTQGLALVMYITPVIYVHSTIQNAFVKALINWNPMSYLVDVPRSLICLGHADHVGVYLSIAVGTVILVAIGLRIFYLLEDLVAERL